MAISDERRRGREGVEVGKENFDQALTAWESASPQEKQKFATAVLANAGAMGVKLADLISDPQKVKDIRSDATASEE